MAMSKRKRERLDVGRKNNQKKPRSSREDDRIVISDGNRKGPTGRQTEDKDTPAVAVEAEVELKSVKGADKANRTKNQEDSEGKKTVIQKAPFKQDAPQTMVQPMNISASHGKPEPTVANLERTKGKKTKTGGHPQNAEEVSKKHKGSRQRRRKRSRNEKSFWEVSDAIGGKTLDLDPIFALNEE